MKLDINKSDEITFLFIALLRNEKHHQTQSPADALRPHVQHG